MPKKQKPRKFHEYEVPKFRRPDKLILACDPGSSNFGIALVGVIMDQPQVYASAMLNFPLRDLTRYNEGKIEFMEELGLWLAAKPAGIIAERFQTRGNGGPLIEFVSTMLGWLGIPDLPVKTVVASQWKNEYRRRFDQDLKEVYPQLAILPHQADAALIGIYGLEQGLGRKFAWKPERVFKQIEQTSLMPVKKRKEAP